MEPQHDIQPDDGPDMPDDDSVPMSLLDRFALHVGVYDEEYGRPNYKALGDYLCYAGVGVVGLCEMLDVGRVIMWVALGALAIALVASVVFRVMEYGWQLREEEEWRRMYGRGGG